MKRRLLAFVLVLAAGVWPAAPARADLQFALTPPMLTGAPGAVLAFIGTLLNPGASDVFLNGTESVSPVGLTLDSEPFFLNTPLFLSPGGSFAGELFDIHIGANVAPAIYAGSFAIRGGGDAGAFDTLAIAQFSVQVVGPVQSVAEPNTALLFAAVLLTTLVRRARQS